MQHEAEVLIYRTAQVGPAVKEDKHLHSPDFGKAMRTHRFSPVNSLSCTDYNTDLVAPNSLSAHLSENSDT
jgi:hypothetical protein